MDNGLALEHAPAFVAAMMVGHMTVLPLLLTGLRWVCNRIIPEAEAEAGADGAGARSPWTARFILFPALQMVLLYAVMSLCFDVAKGQPGYLTVVFALFLLCAAVDGLLLFQMGRSVKKREAEARAALLEERIASYLSEMESVQNLLADTARMRHDLRNHVSVVQLMTARGEYAQARRYLSEAQAQLAD